MEKECIVREWRHCLNRINFKMWLFLGQKYEVKGNLCLLPYQKYREYSEKERKYDPTERSSEVLAKMKVKEEEHSTDILSRMI